MIIYNVILEDHHTDVAVYSFAAEAKAWEKAEELAGVYGDGYSVEENLDWCIAIFRYSSEDDTVRIEETELVGG